MPEEINQKDARIFWNQNQDGKVTDMVVVEFNEYKIDSYSQTYKMSGGACIYDFDKYTPLDILANYYIGLDFSEEFTREDALRELYKIKELRKALRGYAKYRTQFQNLEIPYLLQEI